jgi:hypothetical protein
MSLSRFCCFLLALPIGNCFAQVTRDSATLPGSLEFKINNGRKFWMGSNYRREWRTPITVPVLQVATEKGGLKPTKRGGGKQTKSLRVEDAAGREYSIRSIQKFITGKTLPMDLESEAVEDLVADGISASYPYSALSIPPLAEAAGIPYLKSRVVYIPDDPLLGEYRKDFGNMLAYFEERLPDSVKKGYDTEEVMEKLKEDNDNSVDARALLRARILDMFVMDLDRHEDQWEWGAIEKEKGKMFYPIPKDRDQAFYINQGLIPHIVQWPWLVPQLEGFKAKTKNIKRFNFAARNLDRFFLNELTEQDWKTEVDNFLLKMTDEVIEKAFARQPKEIQHLSVQKLSATLKERRKFLAADVMEYYRFLAEDVNITASDKQELFDISRQEDDKLALKIFKISKEGELADIVFQRTFDAQDTKELRLFGFGGDDRFVVHGNNDKIKVRLIGGDGKDRFESRSASGKAGVVYDSLRGGNTVVGEFKRKMSNDTIANHFDPIGYKYNQVIPFISVGFNPDDGVYLGGWLKVIHHGFRKTPYKNAHTFTINHALATKAFNIKYNAEFVGIAGRRTDLVFETDIRAPIITNFFGYGAGTIYDKTQPGEFRYYRARYNLGDISLLLRKNFSEKVIMTLGPVYQYYELYSEDNLNQKRNIVQTASNGLDPATLFAKQSYVGGKASFTADTRDNKVMPRKGILFVANARHLYGLNDESYKVTQVNSEFTFHLSLVKNFVVIANRFGGGHNFGDFEFYQAQYLGNEDHLRGYRRFRFAGKSKAYNNVDLRIRLANFKTYLFPGSLGVLGFFDAGRLWADTDNGKDDDKILTGYGGGFWISPLRRMVLTLNYAMSEEDKMILVHLGWRF